MERIRVAVLESILIDETLCKVCWCEVGDDKRMESKRLGILHPSIAAKRP